MSRDQGSSGAFAALAKQLHAEPDALHTAQAMVERVVEWLPECDFASLTVKTSKGHRSLASTSRVASDADALQYALDEGPCVEAADDDETFIRSGDVARDARWPLWGPRAEELGVRSVLSIRLLKHQGPGGALNVYSGRSGAFADRDTIDDGLVFAIHAATALGAASMIDNLHTALSSRHMIGMAQGIVMERFGLDQQRSFELLRRLASSSNTKLRDVAQQVVDTGELPAC